MYTRLFAVICVAMLAVTSQAQLPMPAKQVSVSTNTFGTIVPNTNTAQGVFDYLDDHALYDGTATVYKLNVTTSVISRASIGIAGVGTAGVYRVDATTGNVARLVVDSIVANGYNITPGSNYQSITITNGTSTAQMQAQIDAMNHILPVPAASFFINFEAGTYPMTSQLDISGFQGSPSAAIRLVGGVWNVNGDCRTNQPVTLDFSSVGSHGIWISSCDPTVIITDMHIKANTAGSNSAVYCSWPSGPMLLSGCYFEGNSTNYGSLLDIGYSPVVTATSNMFGNAYVGASVGAGTTFINGLHMNTNAPGQLLKYAYGRNGGLIWTNGASRLRGSVADAVNGYDGEFVP